jgi:hypothetical protein
MISFSFDHFSQMTNYKYRVSYWPQTEVIQTRPQRLTIAVEDNIGAGKFILLYRLEQLGFCEVSGSYSCSSSSLK